jgi:hypothetical protein
MASAPRSDEQRHQKPKREKPKRDRQQDPHNGIHRSVAADCVDVQRGLQALLSGWCRRGVRGEWEYPGLRRISVSKEPQITTIPSLQTRRRAPQGKHVTMGQLVCPPDRTWQPNLASREAPCARRTKSYPLPNWSSLLRLLIWYMSAMDPGEHANTQRQRKQMRRCMIGRMRGPKFA